MNVRASIIREVNYGQVSIEYVCPVCGNRTNTIQWFVGSMNWICGACHTEHKVYWDGYNSAKNGDNITEGV